MDIKQEVIDSFKLMWGNFPEPVTLVHRSREIIATNKEAQKIGRTSGIKCSTIGSPEAHKGCKANLALDKQESIYTKSKFGERDIISYWLPVDGYSDLFVHFGVGVTINYDSL